MAKSKLHIICGNCGCNDMLEYEIDLTGQDFGDYTKPSVIIKCRNCSTVHQLEDTIKEIE